jgi:hypothetical protein
LPFEPSAGRNHLVVYGKGHDKYAMQELFYELEGIERNYLDGCEPFISEPADKQMKL